MIALTHNQLVIRHHALAMPLWSPPPEGRAASVRLIQLSDLHFYEYTDPAYYARVSAHVHALKPDIIVITGDFIHFGPAHIPAAKAFVESLPQQCALFAVLGNHDYADTARSQWMRAMLESTRATLLVNDARLIRTAGGPLWVAGVDDYKRGRPDLARALAATEAQAQAPILLLSHNPRQFDTLGRYPQAARTALTLSGHTHAGHVFLPPLTPIYRFVLKMKYRHGFYARDGRLIYVSSGLGGAAYYINLPFWRRGFPRFRYNTRPEIAVFSLAAQVSGAA
ncbi:MAG: metallophosphoesterase [Vampirovibrionales bacterium]|nr:metallophosphoesterase [Vampirovibrionales bacterium]